jgi:hypothetical protein
MLKIQSMCRDIEREDVNEVQIPGKKIESQRPLLDTLVLAARQLRPIRPAPVAHRP